MDKVILVAPNFAAKLDMFDLYRRVSVNSCEGIGGFAAAGILRLVEPMNLLFRSGDISKN